MSDSEETETQEMLRRASEFWQMRPKETTTEAFARGGQLMINITEDELPRYGFQMFVQSMINTGGDLTPAALGFLAAADEMLREAALFQFSDEDMDEMMETSTEFETLLNDNPWTEADLQPPVDGGMTPPRRKLH